MTGTLITLAPQPAELPLLLRIALDAEQIGATRIQLPDLANPEQAITALRQHTGLLISSDDPALTDLADLSGPVDHQLRFRGSAVAAEMTPDLTLAAPAQIAKLAAVIGSATLPVSVICQGPDAITGLLTALAAGAHVRVGLGSATGSAGPRDDVTLVAKAAGIARLIGRPALSADQARALLRVAAA